jgi:hypothetical protein
MEDRKKLIQEKIDMEEHCETIQLSGVKQQVWDALVYEKHFLPGDIEVNPKFTIQLSDGEAEVSIDFIITLPVASFVAIKCSSSAIESWERYVTAFSRAAKEYQIPYAMVTDGERAKIIDVLTGSLRGESIHDFFTREQALEKLKVFEKIPCPSQRFEKEKRIMYAFEGIKCPPAKSDK